MTPSMPRIGEDLAGYRLRAVLGRGGMSVVYEAENTRLGSIVAVKVLAAELATDDMFRTRFLHESRIAASLNHPHVIPIFDAGPCGDLLYISMRYVSGADLRTVLRAHKLLTPDQSLLMIGQVGRALDAAHRMGLVHRDVKPGNFLVERGTDDEPDHVYLADFGITKHTRSRSGLTATGQFVGTIDYIAPEQIQGKPVDSRTDIYSLGCVMYECLTGRVPFQKDLDAAVIWAHVEEQPVAPSEVRPELPRAIDSVIFRAMAKDPDDRFSTCRDFVADARLALEGALPGRSSSTTGPRTVLTGESAPSPTPDVPALNTVAPAGLPPRPLASPEARPRPGGQEAGRELGADAPAVQPPPGNPPLTPSGGRRWRRIIPVAVIILAITVGAVVWATSRGGASHASAHTGSSAAAEAQNPIIHALVNANHDTRLISPSTCEAQGTSTVTCSSPHGQYGGVQTVTFRTFSSLKALYQGYVAEVKSLANGPFVANVGDCTRDMTNGEVSWRHDPVHGDYHSHAYTLAQLRADRVSAKSPPLDVGTQAAGRVYCTISSDDHLHLVWTQNPGLLLGVMNGVPHRVAWDWWANIHHDIVVPGSPQPSMAMQSSMSK